MTIPKNAGLCITAAGLMAMALAARAETPIDLSSYRADCEVQVEAWNGHMRAAWPLGNGETGEVTLDMSGDRPLIEQMAVRKEDAEHRTIVTSVDPIWFLTVGQRRGADEKSPDQKWEVFFDNPHQRPHETFPSKLATKSAKVTGNGKRASVFIDELSVGPFRGSLELSFYAGSRLMRIDALLETEKDQLAVFYDAGLVADAASWKELGWIDTEGQKQMQALTPA